MRYWFLTCLTLQYLFIVGRDICFRHSFAYSRDFIVGLNERESIENVTKRIGLPETPRVESLSRNRRPRRIRALIRLRGAIRSIFFPAQVSARATAVRRNQVGGGTRVALRLSAHCARVHRRRAHCVRIARTLKMGERSPSSRTGSLFYGRCVPLAASR